MLNNRIMHGDRRMLRGGCGSASTGRNTASTGRNGRCSGITNTIDTRNTCTGSRFGCGNGTIDAVPYGDRSSTQRTQGASCPLCARPGMNGGAGNYGIENVGRRTPCNPDGMTNCEKLLEQIRAVDFALVEVVLYLDAYPDCHEALDTYHKLIARRRGLYGQYEASCGPLTAMGNQSTTSWDWIDKPFPWEYKAN